MREKGKVLHFFTLLNQTIHDFNKDAFDFRFLRGDCATVGKVFMIFVIQRRFMSCVIVPRMIPIFSVLKSMLTSEARIRLAREYLSIMDCMPFRYS